MYIVNQDKDAIVELTNIHFNDTRYSDIDGIKYAIWNNDVVLGYYSTIEQVIIVFGKILENIHYDTKIFYMPEDNEE